MIICRLRGMGDDLAKKTAIFAYVLPNDLAENGQIVSAICAGQIQKGATRVASCILH